VSPDLRHDLDALRPPTAAELAWTLSPQATVLVDVAQCIIDLNPACVALAGECREAWLGRPLAQLLAPAPAGRALQALQVQARQDGEHRGLGCGVLHLSPRVSAAAVQAEEVPPRQVLDAMQECVVRYDGDLLLVDANPAALAFLGSSSLAAARHRADSPTAELFDEEGAPLPMARRPALRAILHGEPVHNMTLGIKGWDGRRRWARMNAMPLPALPDGRPAGAVLSFADISETMAVVQALRDSEQRFRAFAEHSQDVIWLSRPDDGLPIYVSPAFERVWGRPVATLSEPGVHWLDFVHPEDRQRVSDNYFSQSADASYVIEYRIVRPDGTVVWIRGRAYPIRDSQGQIVQRAGITEDITVDHEARRVAQAARAAEQQLLRLVATAPGVLLSYRRSPDGQVTVEVANPKVAQAYGMRRRPDGTMDDLREVIQADDRLRLRESLEQSARHMTPWREEFRVAHPKRGQLWVELHAVPLREADGGLVWHGFLHDITDHKRVEETIRQANVELEHRVAERTAELELRHREMESFTYSVSHDLKAPLRGIDGYGKLLELDHAEHLNDEGRQFVRTIRKATVHMGRLIDDLLAYSKVERSRPTLVTINPRQIIAELLQERSREMQTAGIELVQSLVSEQALGEREGLVLAVRNLLDNAIKFSEGRVPRRIEVRCETVDARCRITVSDNGPGFDMRYRDRIFDIFQRLHRAEEFSGTGVGLAIVRKAVQRMNGTVEAFSAPEQGARFVIELPL
jgi:PAS domain S-box-containing protein